MDVSSAQSFNHSGKSSIHKHDGSELNHRVYSIGTCDKNVEENHNNADNVQKGLIEVRVGESNSVDDEKLRHADNSDEKRSCEFGFVTGSSEVLQQTQAMGIGNIQNGSLEIQVQVRDQLGLELVGSAPDDASKRAGLQQVGATQDDENQPANGKKERPRKGKNRPMPLVGSTRTLRSRSQEKPKAPEPVNGSAEDAASREKRRKKKKQMKKMPNDEFSKMRRHLRYFLTRINYEQNLIDAYAGEGWKGQSLEKIRPEKELERAKSEILRRKLKIRDLFQRIDMSCAEGRLPESLFDDQGEIDSEDIFCAKCGFKDVQLDNDIILCDGDCERGFHQFCLEPPLLKEHVPPGDEGWLCPACDCKVDCINLLNESQGTNLSISDSWEKVFPEAAAAVNKLDDVMGLSSDDSEDDDYDPDGPELDEDVEGDESSSDDSDFSSASEDFGAVTNNDQFLALPSDDSEDDDYDPDKLVVDEQVVKESSGSDFTSDSEDDVSALLKEAEVSTEAQGPTLNDELVTLLESDPREIDSSVQSGKGKRHVERLDYKKLHDEEYGCDVSSDSSDEDYSDTGAPKRRKNQTGRAASVPSSRKTPTYGTGVEEMDMEQKQKQSNFTPKKSSSKKPDVEGTSSSPAKSDKGISALGSSSNGRAKSVYKRLGEAVTQRLYESFKENQYPGRGDKENLAKELSLTVQQVSKWFENARWSFNHSDKGPEVGKALSKSETRVATENTDNGIEKEQQSGASPGNLIPKQGDMKSPKTPISRKRRIRSDPQETETDFISSVEKTPKQNAIADSPKPQGARRSGRIQSRSGGKSPS